MMIGAFKMASKYKMVAIFIYFSRSYKMKDDFIFWLFNCTLIFFIYPYTPIHPHPTPILMTFLVFQFQNVGEA